MQILTVNVLDGKGLISVAVENSVDKERLQNYFFETKKIYGDHDFIKCVINEAEKNLKEFCNNGGVL